MVGHGSLSPLARVSGEAWTEQLSCPWHRSSTVRMASSIKHFSWEIGTLKQVLMMICPLTCSAWVSCGLAPGVWVTPGGEMTPGYLMLGGQRSSPGLRRPYWTSCTGAQWVVAEKGTNLFQAMSISWSFKAPQRRIWLLTWIEILVAGGHSMCSESPSHAALWRVESELESSARGSRRSIWKISDLIHLLQSLNKRFNVSLNSANKAFYSGTRPN